MKLEPVRNKFWLLHTLAVKPSRVRYQVERVQIEPTAKCNLKCKMCLRKYWKREEGNMNFEIFKKVIDQFPCLKSLNLQGYGEPLINPDTLSMVRYAKSRGVNVGFNTNATLLSRNISERLVSSSLDWISISLDGATPDTYEKIRADAEFEKVIENIRGLIEAKKSAGKNLPCVGLAVVGMKDNLEEIPKIVELASSLDIKKIEVNNLTCEKMGRKYLDIDESLREQSLTKNVSGANKTFTEARKLSKKLGVNLRLPNLKPNENSANCRWPWLSTYITYDGYVTPCCSLPDARDVNFGNVLRDDFTNIWNCTDYRGFRVKLLSHSPPNACQDCPVFKGTSLGSLNFWRVWY